jgi:hypothetical protein
LQGSEFFLKIHPTSIVYVQRPECGTCGSRAKSGVAEAAAKTKESARESVTGEADRVSRTEVLYSFTDHWYLQPEVAHLYTLIDASGHWAANVRLGSRYAALVVRGDYQPTVRTGELPRPGDDVIAVTEIDGRR